MMKRFMLAHSATSDWQAAVEDCLRQLPAAPPTGANLGFVYATDYFASDLGHILRELQERTGVVHWVGSIGTAICCTAREYYDEAALAIMLCEFPPHSFRLFQEPDQPGTQQDNLQFAVVHGDPRNGQIAQLIEQFANQNGHHYLVGGLTSSHNYYYQIADSITEGQLSGVVFSEEVPVTTGLTQGCTPLGPVHILNDCEGHYAVHIDGRPALDVLKEDIGEILSRDLKRIGGYIFVGFPISGSDTGDYLVRNLVGIDPEQGVLAIGEYLQNGQRIMFCKRDGKSAVQDLERMLSDIQRRLSAPPKGGLYFSCLGRGQHMFGEPSREMELIAARLGDIPLIGFYANGEIAGQRLYGYTGVLTLFL